MTREEAFGVIHRAPVMLKDGKTGAFKFYPVSVDRKCGIFVHGEPAIRWIHHDRLRQMSGGGIEEMELELA